MYLFDMHLLPKDVYTSISVSCICLLLARWSLSNLQFYVILFRASDRKIPVALKCTIRSPARIDRQSNTTTDGTGKIDRPIFCIWIKQKRETKKICNAVVSRLIVCLFQGTLQKSNRGEREKKGQKLYYFKWIKHIKAIYS